MVAGWYHIMINALATEKCASNIKSVISEHMYGIKVMSTSCEIALTWMSQNTFDDTWTLMQP